MKKSTVEPAKPTAPFAIGQKVYHLGRGEDAWVVQGYMHNTAECGWVWCADPADKIKGSKQFFPAGSMSAEKTYVEEPGPVSPGTPAPTPPAEKRRDSIGDSVAVLMDAVRGTDLTGAWGAYDAAALQRPALDPIGTRDKIKHLNPGLQRMGIGNRLRKAWKDGHIDLGKLAEYLGLNLEQS